MREGLNIQVRRRGRRLRCGRSRRAALALGALARATLGPGALARGGSCDRVIESPAIGPILSVM